MGRLVFKLPHKIMLKLSMDDKFNQIHGNLAANRPVETYSG